MTTNIQRLGGRKGLGKASSASNPRIDIDSVQYNNTSPLDSLRNQKREEFSCGDCMYKALQCLFDFTIASCCYTFCNCLRKRRRSGYTNLEMEIDNNSVNSVRSELEEEEDAMKIQLKFHFMNPFQKWKYPERRRFPWKLVTQLLALIVVTCQLWVIATQKFQLNSFVSQNVDTFEQLFVVNPQPPDPTTNYYQSAATSLIITKDDFWNQINYTAHRYYHIRDIAVGPFGYEWQKDTLNFNESDIPLLHMTVEHYKRGEVTPDIMTYSFEGHKVKAHYEIHNPDIVPMRDQLNKSILATQFDSLIALWFEFKLSSVYLDAQSSPLCCQFTVLLELKNRIHSGSMPVSISTETEIRGCSKNSTSYDPATGIYDPTWTTVIHSVVLFLMILSITQCVRSIIKAGRFTKKVRNFFIKHYNYKLRLSEYLPLYNWWFVGVVISNTLVTIGTVLYLITTYQKVHHLEYDDIVSIIYGFGVFLQWCGLLRFLSYFDKYNILLITLRLAMPSVIRFMVCGFIFYMAFLLLGWLVFSPYHPKFRDPSVTSECLFALINGDDMFNTYIQMEDISMPAFIFSKVYLYVFISLFIYVVLSVFISLISDTYETLHDHWSVRSRGLLWDFANDHHAKCNNDTQYELLTGSMYSTHGTPVLTNGGPLLSRAAVETSSNRSTPVILLPNSVPNSPKVPGRKPLYPDLNHIDNNTLRLPLAVQEQRFNE